MTPIDYTIDVENKTLVQKSKLIKTQGNLHGSNKLIKEEYPIQEKAFNTFFGKIKSIEMDRSVVHSRDVLDGIGFRFSTIDQRNDSISLISVSPNRTEEYQLDYKILDAFFELAESTIENYRGISLTENIQDHFSYGLPIKKVSQKPLEYRVRGSFSGCRAENQSLVNLLESLPKDEPILFDLRNGYFAPCLYELLEEYQSKKKVYFYGSYELNRMDLDMEILKEQLVEAEKDNSRGEVGRIRIALKGYVEDRKKIIEKINKKSGSFLSREELIKTIANKA